MSDSNDFSEVELKVMTSLEHENVRELDKKLIELIETNMRETAKNKRDQDTYKNIAIGVALVIGALWAVLISQLNSTMTEMKDAVKQQLVIQTEIKHIDKEILVLRDEIKSLRK